MVKVVVILMEGEVSDKGTPCTLVMEILNLIMVRKADKDRKFQNHFGCKKLKLTHVCFAEDLIMFCHGDKESVNVIKEVIEEFRSISGLKPNYSKSTIIFGSVNEEIKKDILEIVPFKVEKLPVRYLGVPLITRRIGVKDCKCLIDKVRNKVINWKN